jgi:hypothetical protein
VLAPESALGLLPSIALSSAQAERILTKTEPVPCGWTKQSLDNFYIAGVSRGAAPPLVPTTAVQIVLAPLPGCAVIGAQYPEFRFAQLGANLQQPCRAALLHAGGVLEN